jgi:hypothetical protein
MKKPSDTQSVTRLRRPEVGLDSYRAAKILIGQLGEQASSKASEVMHGSESSSLSYGYPSAGR